EFRLPPLRHRPLDVTPLALGIVEDCSQAHHIPISRVDSDFLAALKRYRWPGNLRELKNHVRRAVLFCENGVLTVNDLAPKVLQAQFSEEPQSNADLIRRSWTLADRVALSERELLEQALKENGQNRTRTAKALGLSRVGLYKKLRRLGLMDDTKEMTSVEM
ncbi:MAG TPA: helix-turn-helix domain-containing protein, partial [Planctomicrobium sp.]|nr:helix-turn-helix domain-containing protein [Planctomicrobium sp.]